MYPTTFSKINFSSSQSLTGYVTAPCSLKSYQPSFWHFECTETLSATYKWALGQSPSGCMSDRRHHHFLKGPDWVWRRFEAVIKFIKEAGATLNSQKCEFSVNHVSRSCYWGIRYQSWRVKTETIRKMSPLTSLFELSRFIGMTNQLEKFTSNLTEIMHTDTSWASISKPRK